MAEALGLFITSVLGAKLFLEGGMLIIWLFCPFKKRLSVVNY